MINSARMSKHCVARKIGGDRTGSDKDISMQLLPGFQLHLLTLERFGLPNDVLGLALQRIHLLTHTGFSILPAKQSYSS